ncbi:hypothetical protein GOODEAATRI_001981 [Goodea atripinnis]|uniref:Uncharacterized protein n=1 Tax=Goodea atripinnis TaxID=208336 RepID=A0ABV0PK90_9TELE
MVYLTWFSFLIVTQVEKEACEAKLSKLRLQNKAKVTSLTSQLEELKKRQGEPGTPTRSKKRKELEFQQQRGEEMDAMLTEKDQRLAEKEAYIVHLQTGLAGDHPITAAPQQKVLEVGGEMQELQLLVQSLTKKVEEAEERYSLVLEQTDSLKDLLASEKEQYSQKESMYKQNVWRGRRQGPADKGQPSFSVFLYDVNKQELTERLRRLQVERESLESKMEAEKHVMRAQLRDLMEKHQVEVQRLSEQHRGQMDKIQQDLLGQLEELRRTSPAVAPPVCEEASEMGNLPSDLASVQRIAKLEG